MILCLVQMRKPWESVHSILFSSSWHLEGFVFKMTDFWSMVCIFDSTEFILTRWYALFGIFDNKVCIFDNMEFILAFRGQNLSPFTSNMSVLCHPVVSKRLLWTNRMEEVITRKGICSNVVTFDVNFLMEFTCYILFHMCADDAYEWLNDISRVKISHMDWWDTMATGQEVTLSLGTFKKLRMKGFPSVFRNGWRILFSREKGGEDFFRKKYDKNIKWFSKLYVRLFCE